MTDEAPRKFPRLTDEDRDIVVDAFDDLRQGGYATLHPDTDPETFIYWLDRYYGLDQVSVSSHTDTALILFRPWS